MGFDSDTREMKVLALNKGVTREQVQDNTGFKLLFEAKVERPNRPARMSWPCCASWTRSGFIRRNPRAAFSMGMRGYPRARG